MIKPSSCLPCPLYDISQGFIENEGQGEIAILGEYGGYQEFLDALPFRPHAAAGSCLEGAFKIVAKETAQPCSRSQFRLGNVVNCCPPGDKFDQASYAREAVSCCQSNVDRLYGGRNRVTLALGNIPLRELTGVSGIAEEKQSISHLRGYVLEGKYGKVVASYNPAFIRRGNPHLTPLLVEDIKKALAVARGTHSNYPSHKGYVPPRYQTSPGVDEVKSFYYYVKDNPKLVLSYDIETNETGNIDEDEREDLASTEIVQVQWSYGKGSGIAIPWNSDYLPLIKALFLVGNPKANHNTWNFDNPRLKSKGIQINGKVHDTMWMFKHYHPGLPRGLQSVASYVGFPFPWKHLYGSNLPWYGCADVDAVQWLIAALPALMKAKGVWGGYLEHVYNLNPIFEGASERGIPVSIEKHGEVKKYFTEERGKTNLELQKSVPLTIRNVKPKRKDENGEEDFGYIREPKIVGDEYEVYREGVERLSKVGKKVVAFEEYLWRKHNLCFAEFERHDEGTGQRVKIERWCRIEEFKASSQQVVRYLRYKQEEIQKQIEELVLERAEKWNGRNPELTEKINELVDLQEDYEVPKNLKTKKDTTSKKDLEEIYFKTGDKVLEQIAKIRSLDTNLNNFLPNWEPRRDGKVHPSYGYTAPTGQINSWQPNSQNVSKHTEFGQEFRRIVVAPPGYCFVEADKKSFHVATMGYCANDRDYIRFSQIDPHSILGSYIDTSVIGGSISLKWSDADIKLAANEFKKRCKEHKKKDPTHNIDVRQELAKPTVLGNQLELGAKKLQRQNQRFIKTVRDAERMQEIIAGLFSKEERYKKYIKEKAHIEHYLVNEFARIQYFYDVFQFKFNPKTRSWNKKDGEGAREPIAFAVQGTAFGMITDELLELNRVGACEKYNFALTIHDSLVFMPRVEHREECIALLLDVMNRPCSKLVNEATGPMGLKVGVEVSTGVNWKNYDKSTNETGMREI